MKSNAELYEHPLIERNINRAAAKANRLGTTINIETGG